MKPVRAGRRLRFVRTMDGIGRLCGLSRLVPRFPRADEAARCGNGGVPRSSGEETAAGEKKSKKFKIIVDSSRGSRLYTPHQRRRHTLLTTESFASEFRESWAKSREPRERHSIGLKPKAK